MSEYKVREQAYYWLAQMQEQALTPAQDHEFKIWLNSAPEHAIAFAEAELMWRALADEKVKAELGTILSAEKERQSLLWPWWQQAKSWFVGYKLVWLSATAASVLLLFIQYWLLQPVIQPQLIDAKYSQLYTTAVGENREITLDDGSRVWLDANSSIEASYTLSQRSVLLTRGSAFFDVTHDSLRPFIVSSGAVEVEVTGTEFDVQRKQDLLYVAVEQGSVVVSQPMPGWKEKTAAKNNKPWSRRKYASLAKLTLTRGQGVKVDRLAGLGQVETIAPGLLASWRRGKLVYINRSLDEVVQDMNRYSPMPVLIDSQAKALKLSGTFDSRNIPAMLNVIQTALPVTVENKGGQFHINVSLSQN